MRKWNDLDLFFNGSNFMRNEIIIPMMLIMAFSQVTQQKLYLSVYKVGK